jgi:hypothetical protein
MEDRNRQEEVFSKRVRAGRKRTYFIDVKATRNSDFYITITESERDFNNPDNFIKHKVFLYKEDFNKFLSALTDTIDYVKTELMPDFQFNQFDRDEEFNENLNPPEFKFDEEE